MDTLFDFIDPPKKSTDWKWSFADYPKEKNGLKVFSCFACGGGSTMGYKLAGCDVIGCVEIDPKMNAVYVRNHHPRHNYLMDIRDFNAIPNDQLPPELFNLDILDGSPPCTTFSMAGDREESWGKKKKFREGQKEQTLDDLSFVFIDTVRKLKPRVVIMENVEGLILGEAFSYVQRIYKKFQEAGYFVHHWFLKGETMGIPQRRHRTFFVACRADLQINPSWLDLSFNYEPILFGSIKEGVGKEVNEGTEVRKWLLRTTTTDRDLSDAVIRAGEPTKLWAHKLLQDDVVANTLAANGDFYRGTEKTYVSNEDIRNLQTFPADFQFPSEKRTGWQYICGMSVPPVMIKRIVTRLIEQGVFDYAKSV